MVAEPITRNLFLTGRTAQSAVLSLVSGAEPNTRHASAANNPTQIMPKHHNNPTGKELNDQMFREMAEAGVLKVVSQKLDDGKLVPVYAAVPPDEWSAAARAFMNCSEEEMQRRSAEHHKALGERPRLDRH